MGYDTTFAGEIEVRPTLPPRFVSKFNEMRRRRNNKYGDGEMGSFDHVYYGKVGLMGQTREDAQGLSVVPGVWCQWEIVVGGDQASSVQWDGDDKFYDYEEWLAYVVALIKTEFPASEFSGEIRWWGEDPSDLGCLRVAPDGTVTTHTGEVVYGDGRKIPPFGSVNQ